LILLNVFHAPDQWRAGVDIVEAGLPDRIAARASGMPSRERSLPPLPRVQANVRYTRDILHLELLHTPRRMLELRAGDCDDMTILLGSMLRSTGHPVRIVLCGFRRDRPHAYSHIYPEVQVGRRWVALDATMPHPPGWAPPAVWKRTCLVTEEGLRC